LNRHRARSDAAQGSATFPNVVLLDCFAPFARTAGCLCGLIGFGIRPTSRKEKARLLAQAGLSRNRYTVAQATEAGLTGV
jgi:hypothetical protein